MRVKKRVKRGVKKGMKKVKSAPPEGYVAGGAVLVGGAAVLLLSTTKRGRELLMRTAQLALRQEPEQDTQESDIPEADEQDTQESDIPEADDSQDSDAGEDLDNEPAENDGLEGEPGEETNDADESRVTDLKPQPQRPRSAAPGRRPRRSKRAPAPAEC